MTAVLVLYLISFVLGLAMIVRVWRASVLDGILTLLVPLYVFVALIKYWGNPDHDIRYFLLGQVLVSGAAVAMASHVSSQLERELAQQQAEQGGGAGNDADDSPGATAPDAPIDSGAGGRSAHARSSAGGGATRAEAASASRYTEPDTPPRAPTAEELAGPTLRQVMRAVTYQRGAMERSSGGFRLQIPDHFHALTASDAHRIEGALQLTPDQHEVAWIAHESVALDAPDSWHIVARWLNEGWVAAGGVLDPWQLLKTAQAGGASRLAGSGGDLIGFAVEPTFTDGVADWVEERLPPGAKASVLDCHAVRLGRRGLLEFSVVGQPVGAQRLCSASVRLMARETKFEPELQWTPAAPDGAPRAGYTLADLIAAAH